MERSHIVDARAEARWPVVALVVSTWQALLLPKRLFPLVVVSAPLLLAQWVFAHSVSAMLSAFVMLFGFMALGPASWRVLMPLDRVVGWVPVRLAAYGALAAAVVSVAGYGVPGVIELGTTFLTAAPSLGVVWGMWCVGGWGLGRDIELEASLTRARARAEALDRAREQAELMAIRTWLDPHFLFNTLNAIAEWTREDPVVAEAALVKLAATLRTVLGGLQRDRWSLAEELRLVDAVCALHHTRDPSRFTVERVGWGADDPFSVPPMLLLPLIENAMKHGIGRGHRGPVRIEVVGAGASRRVVIESPGPWGGERPGGHGLLMVRRRLFLAFAEHARLIVGPSEDPGRTRSEVVMARSMEEQHG
jgi:hypothetical protein